MDSKKPLPTLRVARPTDQLDRLVAMYRDGLELDLLGSFEDHEGFDGVMLGRAGSAYHLEFTHERGKAAGGAPSGEHLLVFYDPDEASWLAACSRMKAAGFEAETAHNPYWERNGQTFRDADGYLVVLVRGASPV